MNALHTMPGVFFVITIVITKLKNYGKKNRTTMDGTL